MARKKKDKNTIILNRICIGDYLNEGDNVGHEIVNLFKPDEKEFYYIYLMSDGSYPAKRKYDTVEAIYFTKALNDGCLEVVAVATKVSPVFVPDDRFKCFVGGGGKDELDRLFKECLSREKLDELSQEFSKITKTKDFLDSEIFASMRPFSKDKTKELESAAKELYLLANDIDEKKNKDYNDVCKAIRRRAAHIEQIVTVIKEDIRYGGIRVDEFFEKNTSAEYGLEIYATYKAESIVKPKKRTYIINDEKMLENQDASMVDTILIKRDRLATTSLATFFDEDGKLTKTDKIKYDKNGKKCREFVDGKYKTVRVKLTEEEISAAEETEKENYIALRAAAEEISNESNSDKVLEYKPIEKGESDFSFLSLIKKQYDELSYSNMFQYFFTHEVYKHLFLDFLKDEGITLGRDFMVKREENNIDLLVVGEKDVIVIENKIKSGINGIKLGDNGEVVETQLEKYKKYVEKAYPDKTAHFLLFKPDYSVISPEEQGGYTPIAYSELTETFKKGLDIKTNDFLKVYFADFVKSLSYHSKNVDNTYEETMRRRMKSIIEAKKN